jgi:hypothetical protein
MKKHIKIKYGFQYWKPSKIKKIIDYKLQPYKAIKYAPYIIEWWLHNIGYYLTYAYTFIPSLKRINNRCKHVDLLVEVKK